MKKTSAVCGLVGMALILAGCSSTKEVKEVKIIHEHHIYVHNVSPRMNPNMRQMHGQRPNQKFGQSKGGVGPRYDHKPGMMPPKKKPTVSE